MKSETGRSLQPTLFKSSVRLSNGKQRQKIVLCYVSIAIFNWCTNAHLITTKDIRRKSNK